uniref:Mitochondrial ribosomal protein S18C n=1 Tax=Jaculus jaculus TaxID=51337 RepID=A0A8C5LFP4_JACJA
MAALAAACGGPGRKKLTAWVTVAAFRTQDRDHALLSQFISPFTGCIYGRHITGLCGKKQKEITKAIKRAQIMGKCATVK